MKIKPISKSDRSKFVPRIKKIMKKYQPLIDSVGFQMIKAMQREIKKTLSAEGVSVESFLASYDRVSTKAGKINKNNAWVAPLFNMVW